MTDEEALKLKRGDKVEVSLGQAACFGWVPATVFHLDVFDDGKLYAVEVDYVSRRGNVRRGQRWSRHVRLPPCADLDPAPANIYADWLTEHGFQEAAEALREAFPLPPQSD